MIYGATVVSWKGNCLEILMHEASAWGLYKDTEEKHNVGLGHKLGLTATMDVTLQGEEAKEKTKSCLINIGNTHTCSPTHSPWPQHLKSLTAVSGLSSV